VAGAQVGRVVIRSSYLFTVLRNVSCRHALRCGLGCCLGDRVGANALRPYITSSMTIGVYQVVKKASRQAVCHGACRSDLAAGYPNGQRTTANWTVVAKWEWKNHRRAVVVAFGPNSVVDRWTSGHRFWQEHAELRQEGASSSLLAWCNVPVQSYYVAPPIQSKCTVNRLHTILTPCPAMPCPALLPCPAHFGLEHVPVAQH